MFMRRRRRPLAACRDDRRHRVRGQQGRPGFGPVARCRSEDQNARIAQLEAQQAAAAAPPPPAAPVAAPATDMVTRLQELQTLKNQGVLTDAEFEAAKAKVISG